MNTSQAKKQWFIEISRSHEALAQHDFDKAWLHLERSHVLGQTFPLLHVRSHANMLKLSILQRNYKEFLVHLLFVCVAGPASIVNLIPLGNKGRAKYIKLGSMPIDDELKEYLKVRK